MSAFGFSEIASYFAILCAALVLSGEYRARGRHNAQAANHSIIRAQDTLTVVIQFIQIKQDNIRQVKCK